MVKVEIVIEISSTWLEFGLEEKHIESEEHANVFGLGHEECCTIVRDYNNKKCK